jgi:hypothetical protein
MTVRHRAFGRRFSCVAVVATLWVLPALSATPDEKDVKGRARALYQEALTHYNVGDYDRAIDGFKEVYRLTEAPELLYNVAQAYRLKGPGSCGQALRFYRSYLRIEPTSTKRSSVELAIAAMETCAKDEPPPASSEEPPAPSPAPTIAEGDGSRAPAAAVQAADERSPTWTAWPAIGATAGLLAALGGGALMAWAWSDYRTLERSGCAPACDPALTVGPMARQSWGLGLVISGAAVGVAGLIVFVLTRAHAHTPDAVPGAPALAP